MAQFKGIGGNKQLPLMVTWKDTQEMKNDAGELTSVYLSAQKLNLGTQKDAKAGKCDAHPALNDRNVRYSAGQFNAMREAGQYLKVGDMNYLAFRADVSKSAKDKDGKSKVIINVSTDPEKAAKHPISELGVKFDEKLLAKHEKNTQIARDLEAASRQAAPATPAKQAEAEVEAEME